MKVLVTRPASQATSLAEKLRDARQEPVIFPAIAIKEMPYSGKLKKILERLSTFECLIFISPVAVQQFARHVRGRLLESTPLFAVGKSTAEMIAQLGLGYAIYPKAHFGAEALLALPSLQQVSQQAILLCKGIGGNPLIENVLRARSAIVTQANFYQRYFPEVVPDFKLSDIDLTICTSEEGLKNLSEHYGHFLKNKPVMVSSKRLYQVAKQLAFTGDVFIAQNASDEALLACLKQLTKLTLI